MELATPGGSTKVPHPSGRKSHAVLSDGGGMPGVSGEAKVRAPSGPEEMVGRRAKLPGVVPWAPEEGLNPSGGKG